MTAEKRTILVTGGAGGVGMHVSRRFAAESHKVRVFDLRTPATEKVFKPGDGDIEVVWGDITKPESVASAMSGVTDVFHLAAVVPPATEKNPALANAINVGGTRNVAAAAKAESERSGRPIVFRFTSSVTVYGNTQKQTPPVPAGQQANPTSVYAKSKVEAEEIVRNCGMPWTIFRFAAAVYLQIRKGGFEQMRIISPENRLEFIHILDICDAFVNSLGNEAAIGGTFVLGGGERCWMTYRDQVGRMFRFMGMPEPDWRKFSTEEFSLDWYDTTEAQRVLRFQNRTFDDFLIDFGKSLGVKLHLMRLLAGPAMKLLRIRL